MLILCPEVICVTPMLSHHEAGGPTRLGTRSLPTQRRGSFLLLMGARGAAESRVAGAATAAADEREPQKRSALSTLSAAWPGRSASTLLLLLCWPTVTNAGGGCASGAELTARTEALNDVCCDEASEICSGGGKKTRNLLIVCKLPFCCVLMAHGTRGFLQRRAPVTPAARPSCALSALACFRLQR